MRAENPRKRERTRMSVRKDRAIATQRPILCVKGAQGDATWARHLAIARGDARHARWHTRNAAMYTGAGDARGMTLTDQSWELLNPAAPVAP